ncbi:MAG TPA: sugar transferase [Azospirillaceae bacterium]|nr:sugar transferase [Azospirillaceae bacterium]
MEIGRLSAAAPATAEPPRPAPSRRAWTSRGCPPAKRLLDLVLAGLFLILCLPVLLPAALLLYAADPGPVILRQTRIGLHEKPFAMLKLRTMRSGDDRAQRELNRRELLGDTACRAPDGLYKPAHDPRITPVGRIVRRFSIDELPQLVNVLLGEMSLVGPRPSLPWEVALFTEEQRRRHECVPGITGLWQVMGRNRLSMPQMLALDLAYLETGSLALDLWILARTPAAVILSRNTR